MLLNSKIKIKPDLEGVFLDRPNRFVAKVKIWEKNEEKIVMAHVHDSGRITNVLVPGVTVLLKKHDSPHRKTKFDVLFAKHRNYWVLINTKYHREISEEILRTKIIFEESPIKIIPEQKIGESRLDFVVELGNNDTVFVEVKGCTLLENNKALFPDAPTLRGQKHLKTLISLSNTLPNARIILLFLVFHPYASCFAPNAKIDPAFAELFRKGIQHGLEVYPIALKYDKSKGVFSIEKILPLCSE